MDNHQLKPLVKALEGDYRFRPHERLRYFMLGLRLLWGLPVSESIPAEAEPAVVEAIEAYSQLVAQSYPFDDILGPVYMDLASHGSRQQLGQFFTPYPIAEMMSQFTIGTELPEGPDLVRVCDPACGSGVMLLAFLRTALDTFGPEALRRISVMCVDLDMYCANMTATQLLANCNIHRLQVGEIVVLRGNSLTPLEGMHTVLHATAPGITDVLPATSRRRLLSLAEAASTHPDVQPSL